MEIDYQNYVNVMTYLLLMVESEETKILVNSLVKIVVLLIM